MANVVPGSILRHVVICTNTPQQSANVRHWRVVSVGATPRSEQYVCDSLSQTFAAYYKLCMPILATYRGSTLQTVNPALTVPVSSILGRGAGSVGGDTLPPQVAGLISFKTAFAGRAFRGRMYIPFPSETDNTVAGIPSAAYLINLQNLGNAFASTLLVGPGGDQVTLEPVLYRAAPLQVTTITSAMARPAWATQRRRSFINRGDTIMP